MDEKQSQIIGLIGFIIAGVIFIIVGVRSDDMLTIVGSIIWIISCIVWMVPLVRPSKN